MLRTFQPTNNQKLFDKKMLKISYRFQILVLRLSKGKKAHLHSTEMNFNSTTTKVILVIMVFCFLDSQVLGRHISTDDFTMNNEESHESGSVQNYLAMGTDEERNSIFKYILNAYQKVAADNNRLREEYAQLGSVVKFLTDSKCFD